MSRSGEPKASAFNVLLVLRDLMLGGRHSRSTVAHAFNVSLPTADRWLEWLYKTIPRIRKKRISHVTWLEWSEP